MKFARLPLVALVLACFSSEMGVAGNAAFYVTPVEDQATRMRAVDLNKVEHVLYEQSHALLIGQVNYKNWRALPAVRQEILDLRTALEKHRFKVEVHFDLGASEFASVVDDYMRRRASIPNSRIFVYVSGHGWRRNLARRPAGYIVPIDAPSEQSSRAELTAGTIGLPLFAAWAQSPDPRHMLFVFDACFSGSFFGRPDPDVPVPEEPVTTNRPSIPTATRVSAAPPIARGVEASDHIFQPVPRDRGRQFITAGSGNQLTPPDSIFTRLLIDILEGRRIASVTFDNWITARSMGVWLEQNTRREYRGTSNATTPIFGTLRDELYENGDFVFSRKDVPNPYLLAEADDPFDKLITDRQVSGNEEASTTIAIQAQAARNIAEKRASELESEARRAVEAAERAKSNGSPNLAQLESSARKATEEWEKAKQELNSYTSVSSASLVIATQNKSDEEAARLATVIDDSAKRAASVRPPPPVEAQLTADSEKALQDVINALSDTNDVRRHQARKDLAKILSELPTEQRRTATSRLLLNLSEKSYRYQLGVTTALAMKPDIFVVQDKRLARAELELSRKKITDKTLVNATSKVLALDALSPSGMTATGGGGRGL